MPRQRVCVFNKTRQSFLSLDTTVADGHFSRLRGLIGKRRLAPGEGLWLVPCQAIHTIGVFFPIDVVYLDVAGDVIHLAENVSPFRFTPYRRNAHSVLELPVRTIYESDTRVGDHVVVRSAETLEEASARKDWLNRAVVKNGQEEEVEEPAAAMQWRVARPEGN